MNSYIPHTILVINDQILSAKDDETLSRCYALAFDWANRMGKEGKKVFGLRLKRPDPNDYNPSRMQSYLSCNIGCTVEERQKWDEMQKLRVQKAVYDMLSDPQQGEIQDEDQANQ